MSRSYTVSELYDELARRIAAGQGRAPVTMWVLNNRDPDYNYALRAPVTQVVDPDEQFPEVQLWGNA